MKSQYFQGPIGQVAGRDIINHPKWDTLSNDELKRFAKNYKKERWQAFFSEWLNKASLALLILCSLCAVWAVHMLKTDGLSGDIPPLNIATFVFFAVAIGGSALKLHFIRQEAKKTMAEIDSDLKDINSVLRYRKTKR